MKQEIKNLWVMALKSGEYSQTKSHMKDDNGYCCLGVLTDLYIQTTGNGKWNPGQKGPDEKNNLCIPFIEDGGFEKTNLPNSVIKWAGVEDNTNPFAPTVELPDGRFENLDIINDAGYSFDEIANIIKHSL